MIHPMLCVNFPRADTAGPGCALGVQLDAADPSMPWMVTGLAPRLRTTCSRSGPGFVCRVGKIVQGSLSRKFNCLEIVM